MMLSKACPKCGGDVYRQEVEYGIIEYRCLQAGHEVTFEHLQQVMAERKATQESISKEFKMNGIPPKPKKKKDLWKYFEENKEAIVADYGSMRLADFLDRWKMSSGTLGKLKKAWGIGKKWRRVVKGIVDEKPEATVDISLSEHDRYLILLGYQQAIRELIRGRVL